MQFTKNIKRDDNMDFYLTASAGSRIHFPVNPEKIICQTQAKIMTFEVISLGEISLPRGRPPTRFSWDGILPGELHKDIMKAKDWRPPQDILGVLSAWRNNGEKLKLLVTETPINHDVYIDTLEHTWGGGYGDAQYSITIVEAREMIIRAETDTTAKPTIQEQARTAPQIPKTYTVKSGDTLWLIAKKLLGDGGRWPELYALNKGVIGSDPNIIKAGQVLRVVQ